MFVDFKILSAKAVLTCKAFIADNVACIIDGRSE